jgi:hypothetical protein
MSQSFGRTVTIRTFVNCLTKLARYVRARIDARKRRIEQGREFCRELDTFSPFTADDISVSREATVEYQIIYATAMISELLPVPQTPS